jgi:predicted ABC-type ATPase
MPPPSSLEGPRQRPPARVADAGKASRLYVLAGANGAGKSSIGGAMLLQQQVEYFDPDAATRRIRAANPGLSMLQANSAAWHQGKRLLERAIAERLDFAFETTLGGRTISRLLAQAAAAGVEVRVWYVGLADPELHIARVRARVARGGHAIPEARIRERYDASRLNLIRLLPSLTELRIYDNSEEADPASGARPRPKLLLHVRKRNIVGPPDLSATPEWAKPIVAAALQA